ncbi:HK97 gp10 family phage protein [Pseudomonas sp. YuFO20]|uniref:HK97 gp10 family phage protein n=1 Tax=Pseudomonas sp. YuFO20 TaxID=3095362 RepID=UPI002B2512E4|nr:HK97 gp10 family phage protein [Pseudomonas sp. YuFO20]MEB2514791.1 HK97 gp10 family phage protein [Pseudomonas sp. YuFO20]
MQAKYGGKSGNFALELAKFAEQATEAIDASLREIIIEVGNSLIRMSPVDSGRFRGNWHLSIDVVESVTFNELDPQGKEAIAAIAAAVSDFTAGQTAYLINNLPYAIPLEYGHSTQAPQGMVRVTLARFQAIVNQAVRNQQV